MSLREARKQLTRDRIVEHALGLFTANGYAATTIDEIATAAGTTRVTFYAYYPTRVDLMKDFMARVNAVLDRANAAGTSTATDLVELVRKGELPDILAWLESRSRLWPDFRPYLDVLEEAAAVDRDVEAILRQWREEVVADLVRGMELAGRFPADTRHIRGTLAFTQLNYISTLWTHRKLEPNRGHALEVLADGWHHLLCDEG
ncbi:MAG: TetR/AcrR family transcriptional regulator [Paeniglutamicibacter sp.]